MKKHSLFIFTAAFLFAVISCSDSPSLYTVSYDTHGIGKQPHSISVSYGSKLTDAQLPKLTADGKLFGGWYKESNCTTKWNKDNDTVTQDITLYAKWQNTQPWTPLNPATELFTVTFDVQGVGTAPQKISVEKDSKLTDAQLPNLTADGKVFSGWYKESTCTTKWNKNTDTVTKDITLYAKWYNSQPWTEINPATELFIVTFDVQGVGTSPQKISVEKDSKLTDAQLPKLTADGKVFGEWYKEPSCTTKWNKDTDIVTQDMTLYAKWYNSQPWTEINQATELFIVTFDVQGVGTSPQKISVEKDSKLTDAQLPNLTADGKAFDGWYKEPSCTTKWDKDNDTVTQDTTLYAKWINLFKVQFNARGLGNNPAEIIVKDGEAISSLPTPTHITWNFAGWYKDKKNTQAWNDSDKVSENITLHAKWMPKPLEAKDLWKSKTDRPNDYYRIPALAETKDGTLLAVTDLRYNHAADVGKYNNWGSPSSSGQIHKIDIVLKTSDDYGLNWSSSDKNLTNVPEPVQYGCGDAAIVADRDSNEVLIIHVQGNVRYQDGKQSITRLKSTDGGATFTSTDITDMIYGMNTSSWKRMFFTSGKIHQSRFIKVDKYYRIYIAPLIGDFGNTVLYSDDFGDTWKVLGGNAAAKPSPNGDEAKVEELPDGRVVLSSRCGNGRYINIFTYADKNSGTGQWEMSSKWLNLGNDGGTGINGTNGEILIVKACSTGDKTPFYLALQSIPSVYRRKNVTMYWRTITKDISLSDFADGTKWQQKQIHDGTSAYSTMIQQKDGRIGFLYEYNEQGNPAGYDIRYKSLTISEITGGQYEAAFLSE